MPAARVDPTALPGWLAALRDDPGMRALGIQFIPAEELTPPDPDGFDQPMVMYSDMVYARHVEDARHMLRVADGPEYERFRMRLSAGWYVDLRRPDQLWLAPSHDFPPMLFVPGGTGAQAAAAALDGLFPVGRHRRAELPALAKAFAGYLGGDVQVPNVYSGEWTEATGHELDRYFTMNPFVEMGWWGTEYLDNPHPDEPAPPAVAVLLTRTFGRQRRGCIPSMTWQTTWSGSYLSLEAHPRGPVVIAVRYHPSRHTEVVQRLNADFETRYPTDLPVDVLAALLGFGWTPVALVEEALGEPADPDHLAADLPILAALYEGDLVAIGRLRRYLDHPAGQVRATLMQIALDYNYLFLLEEARLSERDPELVAFLDRVLAQSGNPASNVDPFDNFGFSDEPDEWLDDDLADADVD